MQEASSSLSPQAQSLVTILSNSDLAAIADTKILMAILIALVVYRLVSPLVDLFNPIVLVLDLAGIAVSKLRRTVHSRHRISPIRED
ncbi:hypothetical protein LPN04_30945 [Rugamonas sp. A1-17]|nr:hypothetical protein [Rugamonas sp. A1-17]